MEVKIKQHKCERNAKNRKIYYYIVRSHTMSSYCSGAMSRVARCIEL